MLNNRSKEIVAGYLFISPWLIGFLLLTLGPLIASFVISLWKWDLLSEPAFIGLKNYQFLVRDPNFWNALRVTTIYSFCRLPLMLALGLLLAILLNQKIKALGFFRTLFYFPTVLPMVATSMLWMWIFNPQFGILNWILLKFFHIHGPGWLGDERWILPSLILMSLWWVGSNMLVYLGGLQGIPSELYEAANIDGAGMCARFFHITIPMISPVLFYNIIITLINSFETFTQVYVMMGQTPRHNGQFYILYLYDNAFRFYKMGYASALAWVFFFILLMFTLLIFKSSSAWVYYENSEKGGNKNA
jgi:multiple sugar transport system permease protein